MYFFNARAEGDLNKENDPAYPGPQGIVDKPSFRKPIRSQRCLVPASCFLEGTTAKGLSEPFCVWLMDRHLFAFAGIYDTWKDPTTGASLNSFAIVTTSPNKLLQEVPHHRMPVILTREDEQRWMDSTLSLAEVTSMLRQYPDDVMNAYPVTPEVKTSTGPGILNSVGEPIRPVVTYDVEVRTRVELQGMGTSRGRETRRERGDPSLF